MQVYTAMLVVLQTGAIQLTNALVVCIGKCVCNVSI
jgi:hypothetical protein